MDKKPKILFVDDQKLILEGIRRVILQHCKNKWDLFFEVDPLEALSLHQKNNFDVVVTDFSMPKMNGIELAQKLYDINPDTQTIMLSGTADLDTAIEVINNSKIYRLYTKPCDAEILENGIENCLLSKKQKKEDINKIGINVLDRLPIGVIICQNSQVIHINQFATQICSAHDGLSIDRDGNLFTNKPGSSEALSAGLNLEDDNEVALSIDRANAESPLGIIISSIDITNKSQKLVLVSDPEKHTAPSAQNLQTMYDMPFSEARLLHFLVSGYQLKSAAVKVNITEGSARTYLKRIFSRTNTNSQSELVRSILLTPGLYNNC